MEVDLLHRYFRYQRRFSRLMLFGKVKRIWGKIRFVK